MHVLTMANHSHGGFKSACQLMARLRGQVAVRAWPLMANASTERLDIMERAAGSVGADPAGHAYGPADHVLFYMSDYPTIFSNFAGRWREALAQCAGVQIAFNRALGGMPNHHWLAAHTRQILFHDSSMAQTWRSFTGDSPWSDVPTRVLAPPVDLSDLLARDDTRSESPVVIGRLAGDEDVPRDAEAFYRELADRLPDARFWFMPAPERLRAVLGDDPRFVFLERDAMPVADFLGACHVYLLTYHRSVPIPGPRSLMEAMAAGCAPVVVDRDGPRDRVIDGESGYRTNDPLEMIERVVELARNAELCARVGAAARARAATFRVDDWIEALLDGSIRRNAGAA